MKEIVFVDEDLPYTHHKLTASLNMDAALVFDDGKYYPAIDGGNVCEVDDYLLVRADHKKRILDLLGKVFNGISTTCGEVEDARLLGALERVARGGHWKSLDEIEKWLMDRGVPFTKQKWVDGK